jgi:hypothetical protein
VGTANTAITATAFGAVVAMCTAMVVFALGRYDRLRDRLEEYRTETDRKIDSSAAATREAVIAETRQLIATSATETRQLIAASTTDTRQLIAASETETRELLGADISALRVEMREGFRRMEALFQQMMRHHVAQLHSPS